jgi:hypothetical protein
MGPSPAKLYWLSTGTRASWGSPAAAPSGLEEIKSAVDLTIPGTRSTSDTTDRGSGDFVTEDVGKVEAKIAFKCSDRTSDAGRDGLQDAFQADPSTTNSIIALAILDGDKDTAGSQGLWADFKVTKFEESHPINGVREYNVEVTPYNSTVAPEWVVVSS